MQSCIDMYPSLSNKIISANPQIEEHRCRICFEESKPLITLCECSGTIAYVHEDCILDWITKKMESSDIVEIPRCQICRVTYSAKLKIGRKKVCPKMLLKKIRELKFYDIMMSLIYLIVTVLAIIGAARYVFDLFGGFMTSKSIVQHSDSKDQGDGFLWGMLKSIVFPIWFVKDAIEHGKKRIKLLEQSKVQIVEVTLNPKLIIKQ